MSLYRFLLLPTEVGVVMSARTPAATENSSLFQPGNRQEPALDSVIQRAVVYVESFERDFAAVVAEEQLEQRASTSGPDTVRRTRSDLVLVRVPGREEWLPFRDVFEVNGRAVRDRNERLQKLFVDAPTSALTNAARMTSESSRYNIGSIIRTINVPTFALMLLRPGYLKRFEFLKRGDEMIRDVMAWRVEFVERGRPTVVRTLRGEDVPLEGSLWIEPPWVPERMSEWARAANLAVVSSTATYVNFRRFEATGRIVQ